jgi:hypothetical protein
LSAILPRGSSKNIKFGLEAKRKREEQKEKLWHKSKEKGFVSTSAAQQGIDSIRPSRQPSFSPLYSVLARLCSQWREYYGYTALWNGSGGGPNIHLTRGCQPASILLLAAEPFLSSCDEAPLAKEGSTRLEVGNNNTSRSDRDVRQLCMQRLLMGYTHQFA